MQQSILDIRKLSSCLKSTLTVCLSLALQGETACNHSAGTSGGMVSKPSIIRQKGPYEVVLSSNKPDQLPNFIANVQQKDASGDHWLHAAVRVGDPKKVKIVLERLHTHLTTQSVSADAFPNDFNREGYTALGLAIKQGNLEVITMLLDCKYIHPNSAGRMLPSVLLALEAGKQWSIIKLLLEKGGKGLDVSTKIPHSGDAPLHFVARDKQMSKHIMPLLLPRLKKEDLSEQNKKSRTPWHIAARRRNKEAFSQMLTHIYKIYTIDSERGKVIRDLLMRKDKERHTVFASVYFPSGLLDYHFVGPEQMFDFILSNVHGWLQHEAWAQVKQEIEHARVHNKIKQKTSDTLLAVLSKYHPSSTPQVVARAEKSSEGA